MSALEFRGASVRVGSGRHAVVAVDGVDLEVADGTIAGLVGESGSGKSTLARAAVGLVPLLAGEILLGGRPVGRDGGGRRVQLVFQDPSSSLDPRMTAGASIAEGLSARGRLSRAGRREEVGRALELVGLEPRCAELLPRQLSGGQRQRVALARALATRPEVVIADEITSALDVSVRGALLNVLLEVQREQGLTVLFISHDLAVVRYVSDAIAVMHLGRVVERAPADALLSDPRHPYTRTLLAAAPRLRTPAVRDAAPAGEPPDPYDPPSGCRFRTRCPVGPLVDPARAICAEGDPHQSAGERAHHAACHFADAGAGA